MDERLAMLEQRLDALRPLSDKQVSVLWAAWQNDDALFVFNTNAIEGSTLTLAETTAVLEHGITAGGKTLAEHLDAVNGAKAYAFMLELARTRVPISERVVYDLHKAVVGDQPWAGMPLLSDMLHAYSRERDAQNPLLVAAKLHYRLVHIHPFKDGNGRTARLLMNLHLVAKGYPPAMIENTDRQRYLESLEASHRAGEPGQGDPSYFAMFIAEIERRALQRSLAILREVAP